MKHNFSLALIATIIFSSALFSCQKDKDFLFAPANSQGSSIQTITPAAAFQTYQACDRLITIYNPPNGSFTLGMTFGLTYKKFGIPGGQGELNFTTPDIIHFEFSGLYADSKNTIKLYRVRRQDGKYLTFTLCLSYTDLKQPGQGAEMQLWIFNSLGNNKYNLILPKFSTSCWLARTYMDNNIDYIGVVASSQTSFVGSTTLYILPELSTPPNTN